MDNNLRKALGSRIKEERLKRSLTVELLAELADISPSFLRQIESSDRAVSIENLCKFSDIFKISTDSLLKRESNAETSKTNILETLLYNISDKDFEYIIEMIKLARKHIKK